jgi:lipopolysaccharide transport system permease protein
MGSTAKAAYTSSQTRGGQFDRFRRLLWALVVREFKGRYRRSMLGPAWAVIQPLFMMVIFGFMRRLIRNPGGSASASQVSDVLDLFCVTVPWAFLTNAVVRCGPSVYSNGRILKKIAMPREVFPVAAVAVSLIDLAIASIILAGMMIWYGQAVGWALLWVPVLVLLTTLLAMGIGLAIAAVGTYKRDIIFGVPFLMQFWMLASPILFRLEVFQEKLSAGWYAVYTFNPTTGIIDGFRRVLVENSSPDLLLLGKSALGVAVVWAIAWPLFRYMSQYFADVL